MQDIIGERVYQVVNYGLGLRDRLRRNERPDLHAEQGNLKELLGAADEMAPWGRGGGAAANMSFDRTGEMPFLGIRYALTCWLDRLFIDFAPDWWAEEWNDNKLELALYSTQLQHSRFWDQERLSQRAAGAADAADAFWLCVILGFRGELGESQQRLEDWARARRPKGFGGLGEEPRIAGRVFEANVPPLTGGASLRRAAQLLIFGALTAVLICVFALVISGS